MAHSEISDWDSLVNKPVYSQDGKDIGVVQSIQPEKLIVTFGPITPDKYIIPKTSISSFDRGIVYLKENGSDIEKNFRFE